VDLHNQHASRLRLVTSQTQWAVGQGFFHSGTLGLTLGGAKATIGDPVNVAASYVYDCGTVNGQWLIDRELAEFTRRQPAEAGQARRVDLAFISHFDHDHVSGIERLHDRVRPRRYVIPMVPATERLYLAARFLVENQSVALPDAYASLLEDPRSWFGGLPGGAEVTEVLPIPDFDPENPLAGPLENVVPDVSAEAPLRARFIGPGRVASGLAIGGVDALVDDEWRVGREGTLRTVWIWVTYVLPAGRAHLDAFTHTLSASIPGFDPSTLSDPGVLRHLVAHHWGALRDAYPSGSGARNVTSLCLYSGPPPGRAGSRWGRREEGVDRRSAVGPQFARAGWLGAGDADLRGADQAGEFLDAFRSVLPHVGTFAVPHHGAESSWSGTLLDAFSGPETKQPVCLVGAQPGFHGWSHPSLAVMASVADHGGHLVVVTGSPAARWTIVASSPRLPRVRRRLVSP